MAKIMEMISTKLLRVLKMSEDQIETLQKHSQEILLSEIGALIHDIGKLNKFFVEKHSLENDNGYEHGNVLKYESKRDPNFFVSESLENKAKTLRNILRNIKVSYSNEQSNLHLFLKDHHAKDKDKHVDGFVQLLRVSDRFDSDEDRGNAFDQQSIGATYQSNVFGFEKELDLSIYEIERSEAYNSIISLLNDCDMNSIKKNRENFLKDLKNSFDKALGMTARAANDVTLWEHSYMTASIMKVLFAENILSGKNFPIAKLKKEIKEYFKILSIGWDYFDFLSQSQKIPDMIGRREALNEIKGLIKNKIEVEYVLGNCIYADASSIHFLIPAAFKEENTIKQEIYEIFNEKLEGIVTPYILFSEEGKSLVDLMPKSIQNLKKEIKIKQISPDFKHNWADNWENGLYKKKLICSSCGKSFYCENDSEKICSICKTLRKKGRKENFPQTLFIDEIGWNGNEYENVALFILNLNLENWLNGNYVETIYMKKTMEVTGFSGKLSSKIKGIIKHIIGPKVSDNSNLNEKELEKVEKEICDELNRYTILNCNEEVISQKIIKELEKDPPEEIMKNLNDIVKNITEQCGILKLRDKKIIQKNPSPSRLMRVWNNTEDFFKSLEKEIRQNVLSIERYVLDERVIDDLSGKARKIELSANGDKIEGEIIVKKNGKCVTITPHLNSFIKKHNSNKFDVKLIDKEEKNQKTFSKTTFSKSEFFKAYRIVSTSPDQFIFLAPASSSLKILNAIQKKYMEIFGKVLGKLPLNVGIVYFKKNTPLFSVLDSARRFTKNFENEHSLFNSETEIPSFEVKEVNGNEIIFIEDYKVKKSSKLGNCEIDYYHPYLLTEKNGNDEDIIEITTDNQVITQKHVESIKKGDKIKLHPSFFDFEFLDTNGRRFDIVLNEKAGKWKKRYHPLIGTNGPRPYLLNDLNKFKRLKEIFEAIGSWTPILDLESMTVTKRQEWEITDEKDTVYKNIVNSALENKMPCSFKSKKWKSNKLFLLNCILEGSYFDAIELYKNIMKIDLKVKE